jgi:diguanylate cyclase (GGDEF)-like protein
VAFADLDHFKHINDSHGHAAGDAVLHQIGRRMHSMLRVSDAIGRYGGEEFLLVLPRADAPGGREVAERVRAAVEKEVVMAESFGLRVTVSLGVASTDTSGFDPVRLVADADQALYRAKAHGRNCVQAA